MSRVKKKWTPENWSSLMPFGLGHQRPNNYYEVFRAAWENKDEALFAWRILNDGVCDGCALGTSGLKDWTLSGPHLCNIRLRLLRLNTMGPFDGEELEDVEYIKERTSEELKEMGRIPYPMIRRKGDAGFERISWKDALKEIAEKIRETDPVKSAYYLTSRGVPNETYYAAQKAIRSFGTNNLDNAARICHSPSTVGLKESVGIAATTCSYIDWLESDLIVFIGSNMANNQPVATKYIHYAKKNGARVAMINNYREPGMENYWIPSIVESSLFGTKICDDFYGVNIGGDVAFLNGVLKHMFHNDMVDEDFISEHCVGFDELKEYLSSLDWKTIEEVSGAPKREIQRFAQTVADADKAVFVWSMGITQHETGVDNVKAIVNLALSKGFVGRLGCGLMPIRGHSGVQGGAEMGCYATAYPGGRAINEENAAELEELWGFRPPSSKGKTITQSIDEAGEGNIDLLFSVGGNFLEVLPQPDAVEAALEKVSLRVHVDIFLSSQMLVDPGETVIILPATTRYEIPGGCCETSTERRVIFSPEIPGRRIEGARCEWEIFSDLAKLVHPDRKESFNWKDTSDIRNEIARVIPVYDGIQYLQEKGDQFQYGGRHLCWNWEFPTPDGKAHFSKVEVRQEQLKEGHFRVATRRGKQFNSMVHEYKDSLNGADRDAILMNRLDMEELELEAGDLIEIHNDDGSYSGSVVPAPIQRGNLQVHWPEGNVLLPQGKRSKEAGVPDYNATVQIKVDE